MNIKKRIYTSLILTGCIALSAAAQKRMTVSFNNGSADVPFAVSEIASLHFGNGQLQVKQAADGKVDAVSLAEILSIKFADVIPSEIKTAATEQSAAVKIAVSPDELRLVGYDTTHPQPAYLYGVGGAVHFSTKALTVSSINVSSLPKGLYILKIGKKSFKISK